MRRLRFLKMDLPELKTMIQAGGKLNAIIVKEYVEAAQANGKEFIVMYGQTEAAPRMSYLPFDKALEKYASIGIAPTTCIMTYIITNTTIYLQSSFLPKKDDSKNFMISVFMFVQLFFSRMICRIMQSNTLFSCLCRFDNYISDIYKVTDLANLLGYQ